MGKLYPLLLLVLAACASPEAPADKPLAKPAASLKAEAEPSGPPPDTVLFADTLWLGRYGFDRPGYRVPDSIAGQPIAFYLTNPQVSSLAKALYTGRFRPTDDEYTTQLLDLATTDDAQLRPFYRWCLGFTIAISDGALGEYPGQPALEYAVKFPREFLTYSTTLSPKQRQNWVNNIAYSGLSYPAAAAEDLAAIKKQLVAEMRRNCPGCPAATQKHISRFVEEIIEERRRIIE